MMTQAKIDELQREYNNARSALSLAQDDEAKAKAALAAAKVEFANQKSHPLLGKQVSRKVRYGYRAGQTKTIRGTLAVYDPAKHRGLRGVHYSVSAGDLIVISASGQTGYLFDWRSESWKGELKPGETDWTEG